MNKRHVICALKLVVVALIAGSLMGFSPKEYPARPVTLIVPFAAGGGTDSRNKGRS